MGLSRDVFRALAQTYRVVPVWCSVLADTETPVSAFIKLVGAGTNAAPGYVLESVEHAERWGRFSFVGRDAGATLVARGETVSVDGVLPDGIPLDRGILATVDALLAQLRAPELEELPPFHGGIVGSLAYDIVREIEALPDAPADPMELPRAVLFVGGIVVAFDHLRQCVTCIDNVLVAPGASDAELDAAYDNACARLAQAVADLERPLPIMAAVAPADVDREPAPATSSMAGGMFADAVAAAREHILAGDIFQVVLAQRFTLEGSYDPLDVYRVLRQLNPSPYMYFLRHPDLAIAGSSPEPLVQVRNGRVISRPIAGTRRRGANEMLDRRMAAELTEDPKERAEHVMLVDLARNDLGRVVEFGSERVDEFMTLERYSHVMHLTSQVSGALAPDTSLVDVLRATFPAGTVSGAPKVRAMEIIDALEPVARGPYAGVVGYLDFSGNLDTAIAIRTMLFRNGTASVQAGAGIVADSDPAAEDLECRNKARALLVAAAAARGMRTGGA
ncbi:MAG: anthranilate synthase component I family protein [Acidimicrobiia bacterium]